MINRIKTLLNNIRSTWHQHAPKFPLKVGNNDFAKMLLEHAKREEPQALQGQWQAYGQIEAARTAGRYSFLTAGTLGIGLALYEKRLNEKQEELKKKEDELGTQFTEFNKNINEYRDVASAATEETKAYKSKNLVFEAQLANAEEYTKKLYGANENCFSHYEHNKGKRLNCS